MNINPLVLLIVPTFCFSADITLIKEIKVPQEKFDSSASPTFSYNADGNSLIYIPKYSSSALIIHDESDITVDFKSEVMQSIIIKNDTIVADKDNKMWRISDKGELSFLINLNDYNLGDLFSSQDQNAIASRETIIHYPFTNINKVTSIPEHYPIFNGNSFGRNIAVTAGQINHSLSKDTWLEVWDAHTGDRITNFDSNDEEIYGPVIVDEDKGLLFFQWDDKFTLWDYKTNTIIDSMKIDIRYGEIKKENNQFQAYGFNSIQRFSFKNNTISRTLLCKLPIGNMNTPPQFSADGNYILTEETNNNKSLSSIYSVTGNSCKKAISLPPIWGYYALHPTQRIIASYEDNHKTIKIYSW